MLKKYIGALRRFRHHFRLLAVSSLRGNDVEKDEDGPRSGWSEHRGLGGEPSARKNFVPTAPRSCLLRLWKIEGSFPSSRPEVMAEFTIPEMRQYRKNVTILSEFEAAKYDILWHVRDLERRVK